MQVIKLESRIMEVNSYVVYREGREEAVLIDPAFEPEKIRQAVAAEGLRPAAILLTHGHFDHIAGVDELRKAYEIPVYIHAEDGICLTKSNKNLGCFFKQGDVKTEEADVLLADGDTFTIGDMEFSVLHTPGHTKGSVCYAVEDLLFTGDTLFNMSIGNCQLPGGDAAVMQESLLKLENLEKDYIVHPGHGSSTSLAHEIENNPYLGN